jgi:polysaccharide deacetylase family protein (PEP-CTERM system associated)
MKNILTIDLEDWFQSSLELFDIKSYGEIIKPTERVVNNTRRLLDIFKEYNTKATFFVLGTVAEHFPKLIEEIHRQGHEIATHGYGHRLVYRQTKEEFRQDLRKSMQLIQDIIGEKILGYRAPYFSVREDSLWALDVIKEEGLRYDASIFPLKRKLYGVRDIDKINIDKIIELPVSKISLFGYEFPFGGGGYLRLYPYGLTKWAIKKLNKQKKAAMVYIHPYEIDTDELQDDCFGGGIKTELTKFTQRFNRGSMENKIIALLKDFSFTTIKGSLSL